MPEVQEELSGAPHRRYPAAVRLVAGVAVTALAGAVVWAALTMPEDFGKDGLLGFVRVPIEALALMLLALLLPRGLLRAVAGVLGVVLGLAVLLKALDIGFTAAMDRPFDLLNDWSYLGSADGVLADAAGVVWAVLATIGAIVAAVAIVLALPLATVRITGALARHRRRTGVALVALAVLWVVCALAGVNWGSGQSVASASTSRLAWGAVGQVRGDVADRAVFAREIATDPVAGVPANRLLSGLRGKDVLLVFVESYGRVALTDPTVAAVVRPSLEKARAALRSAGFSARSAYLVSPTFGGSSWLAHSTVETGLWVDSQQRYDQLLSTHRRSLVRTFGEAGWRTVFDIPAMDEAWPQGRPFYGFEHLLTEENVGYHGPRFGYDTIPDQYTLQVFRDRELAPASRPPVMAEIDLLSSHYPWTPPPRLLPWGTLGDGTVFGRPAGRSPDADGTAGPKVIYGQTIAYALRALASFAATSHDPNLVIIAMGDHQPNRSVTRPEASHQVPAMVIAHDPAVLRAVTGWGWSAGLAPGPHAPVWRMSALRDRIFTTFGSASS